MNREVTDNKDSKPSPTYELSGFVCTAPGLSDYNFVLGVGDSTCARERRPTKPKARMNI